MLDSLRRFGPGLAAACVVALSAALARPAQADPIRAWGLRFDYQLSRFAWEGDYWPSYENKTRTGYGVTAFAEWFDRPVISLRTGLSYAQRGGALEWDNPSTEYPPGRITDDMRLDYVTVSAVLKLRYETPHVFPYLCAGPFADIYAGHVKQCQSEDAERPCWDHPLSFSETGYRSVLYGISAGGGVEFRSEVDVTPVLEFLYERGVSGAFSGVPAGSSERVEADYECFTISGGFMF